MSRGTDFWHERYTQQVRWTLETRRYIFDCINARPSDRILEVGCGTGALLASLTRDGFKNVIGLDKDLVALQMANSHTVTGANSFNLPFPHASFDFCLSHFLLLWIADPLAALKEMQRATKPGGWLLALAEPDYGGRIDFPTELEVLGKAQTQALQSKCADISIGRKLRGLFLDCGLKNVRSGIINAEWTMDFSQTDFDLEWAVLRKDLMWKLPHEELDRYYCIDLDASRLRQRVLFVPIFYAFGQVAE